MAVKWTREYCREVMSVLAQAVEDNPNIFFKEQLMSYYSPRYSCKVYNHFVLKYADEDEVVAHQRDVIEDTLRMRLMLIGLDGTAGAGAVTKSIFLLKSNYGMRDGSDGTVINNIQNPPVITPRVAREDGEGKGD